MISPLVIIPARLASTRLPGKPLAEIAGRAMILRVLDVALAADVGPVAVAAADQAIYDVVTQAGGRAVLTDPGLPSGSDRAWQAAQVLDPDGAHDVIINLQGDLPTLSPDALRAVMRVMPDPAYDIGTLIAPVLSEEEKQASSVVKVACHFEADTLCAPALYFSRTPIPWGEGTLWHHIGIYGWRREALKRFVSLPESGLERRENLEQLRALEAGMRIGCARIEVAPFGVDTPADLERARRHFQDEHFQGTHFQGTTQA
ncbi:3-deoxy-manno-octulosonate cytidylyltransferase [Acetobacter farinalis]|uniref:3-deoxy-manno-octulosonate cytidylyltransferase n=1 Tax=Acetobacter farinalis TaxID=1260984 RepID=A0ABT3Q503_9PROT|nr:3-deoxy-manno-octulosonate cytidylyltransferase [Acetobacter farinalis]MCX2560378.1 3-deoxy-manno-octulosonate cytidylyltransferase [Acetobacter farinalis]NHO29033.1 3-deoxy-manno-octulosonate cytidylyltransferase [Acetobacter farinalis]